MAEDEDKKSVSVIEKTFNELLEENLLELTALKENLI